MKTAARWLGFALVAAGVAVFPFTIWFPGPSSTLALVSIILGCFVLLFALERKPLELPEIAADDPDEKRP